MSVRLRGFADLTDVTLADEDIKSILTEQANRAIQGNVAMQTAQSGGKLWNQCKWRHLVAKFGTNASGTIWWSNLQLMQVAAKLHFSGTEKAKY